MFSINSWGGGGYLRLRWSYFAVYIIWTKWHTCNRLVSFTFLQDIGLTTDRSELSFESDLKDRTVADQERLRRLDGGLRSLYALISHICCTENRYNIVNDVTNTLIHIQFWGRSRNFWRGCVCSIINFSFQRGVGQQQKTTLKCVFNTFKKKFRRKEGRVFRPSGSATAITVLNLLFIVDWVRCNEGYITSLALVIFNGWISGTITLIANRLAQKKPRFAHIHWMPYLYISAGVPNIIMLDSKDTSKDMATGRTAILRLPTRYSEVVLWRPPDRA